jgi:glutamate synthase domain-containing protein 3
MRMRCLPATPSPRGMLRQLEAVEAADDEELKGIVSEFARDTGSAVATALLSDWAASRRLFVKAPPPPPPSSHTPILSPLRPGSAFLPFPPSLTAHNDIRHKTRAHAHTHTHARTHARTCLSPASHGATYEDAHSCGLSAKMSVTPNDAVRLQISRSRTSCPPNTALWAADTLALALARRKPPRYR